MAKRIKIQPKNLSQQEIKSMAERALNDTYALDISNNTFNSMKKFAAYIEPMYLYFKEYAEGVRKVDITKENVCSNIPTAVRLRMTEGQQMLVFKEAQRLAKMHRNEHDFNMRALKGMLDSFDNLPDDLKDRCIESIEDI